MAEEQQMSFEEELTRAKKQAEEYLNGWKRAKADYMNLERQVEKEKAQWMHVAVLPVVMEMITLVEHLAYAFTKIPLNPPLQKGETGGFGASELEQWIQGIAHTRDDMKDVLKSLQVERIATEGEKLDLARMEVVAQEKVESAEPGTVLREVGAGYTMAGNVIKVSKVVVAAA